MHSLYKPESSTVHGDMKSLPAVACVNHLNAQDGHKLYFPEKEIWVLWQVFKCLKQASGISFL